MPWTVKDVSKHKKGLTDTQKKKWVSIANSVRAQCLKDGNDEKTCDARAIRIANSQVNSNIQVHFETQYTYTPRVESYQGKEYIVVPVVMMTEGVHNGSRGAVYHSPDELGKIVEAWNGIPVTISHPMNEQGEFVSANSPNILSSWAVGQIFNARMDGIKLKAEAWLDVQRMTSISPDALERVRSGEIMEVSVGIFSDEIEEEGDWNNEHYIAVAKNYRPDHLALLPGETGACSVADGCGLRVNKQKGGNDVNTLDVFKELNKQGFSVSPIVNEVSFSQIMDQLYSLVDGRDNDTERYYLEDVYDDYVVYRKRKITQTNDGEISGSEVVGLFKQAYQIDASDKVAFVGEPVEVKKSVSYVTLKEHETSRKRTKFNTNKKEENGMCAKCPEKVNELIAHSATHFDEKDKEWLGNLTEDQLDKLIPKVQVNKTTEPVKVEVTEEEAWKVLKLNKEQYDMGVKIYNDQRTEVTKEILANSEEGVWKEEDLKEMKLDVLKKVAKSLKKKEETLGNYSGMGAGIGNNGQGDSGEAPYIPSIEFADKK